MDETDIREFWDAQAARFDDEPDHGLRDPATREAWRDLLREVLPEPPARVADLGCGTGSLAVLLAEEGYAVHGVDQSPEMVALAATKARDHGVDLLLDLGDAAEPPVEPESVDVVLVRHVTWALPDPATAIKQWRALLRPEGRLVLIEGQWALGAGLTASALTELVSPQVPEVDVRPLTDEVLWGQPTDDERYLLLART